MEVSAGSTPALKLVPKTPGNEPRPYRYLAVIGGRQKQTPWLLPVRFDVPWTRPRLEVVR